MPTMGALRCIAPSEPKNAALPYEKTPPSAAATHTPFPVRADAIPTIGAFVAAAVSTVASPSLVNAPDSVTVRYPCSSRVGAMPTALGVVVGIGADSRLEWPMPAHVVGCDADRRRNARPRRT